MRFLNLSAAVLLALGLGACGSISNQNKANNKQDADVTARAEKFSQLPKAAILAVPVDANGNEMTDKAELRVLNKDVDMNKADSLASAYSEATKPATVIDSADELNSDSSTQAWWRWGGYGYGCYRSCWFGYRPAVWYGGYNWNYGWGGYGYWGGYNYYGYRSAWYW